MATEKYKSAATSGVLEFDVGDDFIVITFHHGGRYLYSYHKPGRVQVERMKKLARAGKGLNTYINVNIREKFEKKLR